MQYAYSMHTFGTHYVRHQISPWTPTLLHKLTLRKGLWVRTAEKACWHAYYEIRPEVVWHPGTSGILHLTYYVCEHTKSFSGILNSMIVCHSERNLCFAAPADTERAVCSSWGVSLMGGMSPVWSSISVNCFQACSQEHSCVEWLIKWLYKRSCILSLCVCLALLSRTLTIGR